MGFKVPVDYYSTLMAVAYGRSAKAAALNGQIIPAKQLEVLAAKQSRASGLFLCQYFPPPPPWFSSRLEEVFCFFGFSLRVTFM